MRSAVYFAMLASAIVTVSDAHAQTELRASVDPSEWTPSNELVLNLATGGYVVYPSAEDWPRIWPKPEKRTGRLLGESLAEVRALAQRAFKRGLVDQVCEAQKGDGFPIYGSNARGPMLLSLLKGQTLKKSDLQRCRTEEAHALFRHITQLFDHRSP